MRRKRDAKRAGDDCQIVKNDCGKVIIYYWRRLLESWVAFRVRRIPSHFSAGGKLVSQGKVALMCCLPIKSTSKALCNKIEYFALISRILYHHCKSR